MIDRILTITRDPLRVTIEMVDRAINVRINQLQLIIASQRA